MAFSGVGFFFVVFFSDFFFHPLEPNFVLGYTCTSPDSCLAEISSWCKPREDLLPPESLRVAGERLVWVMVNQCWGWPGSPLPPLSPGEPVHQCPT